MVRTAAIQGIPGSYSDSAVDIFLDGGSLRLSFDSFRGALGAVAGNTAEYAVVPVHNSLAGRILEVDELIRELELKKLDLAPMEIRHVLVAPKGSALQDLKTVSSHRVALAQCGRFFKSNPQLRTIEASDTATSVRDVAAAGEGSAAAIGSRRAAELYGGEIILERVADAETNITTFCLVGRQ
jgi:prephenate dehydratase